MSDKFEIWGQDSPVKGLRIVRFLPGKNDWLQWFGQIEDEPEPSFKYHRQTLIESGWERIE